MTNHGKLSQVEPRRKHIWIRGFVIAFGVVLVGFFAWFLITVTLFTSDSQKGEAPRQVPAPQAPPLPGTAPSPEPPVASKVPVDAAAALQSQLAQVLTGIKEANQKKDLPLLLSHYSPNFPQLQQKAQNISKNWKTYDYLKMDFHLKEVRLLADQTAVARVTWNVETLNISTRKNKSVAKTYLIRFARESGQWRIRALDPAE
jgi:hypothetical protein